MRGKRNAPNRAMRDFEARLQPRHSADSHEAPDVVPSHNSQQNQRIINAAFHISICNFRQLRTRQTPLSLSLSVSLTHSLFLSSSSTQNPPVSPINIPISPINLSHSPQSLWLDFGANGLASENALDVVLWLGIGGCCLKVASRRLIDVTLGRLR